MKTQSEVWTIAELVALLIVMEFFFFDIVGVFGFALAALVYPTIVPFRVSLWQASYSHLSQLFLMIGVSLLARTFLVYSFFVCWIFHGRTPEAGWEL